jgi:drug/metabolite transporter superfamily protein YnfA
MENRESLKYYRDEYGSTMLAILKNSMIDLVFAIWGGVFVIQGIIIFSVSPVMGGMLLVLGAVLALIGSISYMVIGTKNNRKKG